MSSDDNGSSSRKRKRYNKLLLDPYSIPAVSRQTLTRWSKYGSRNEKSIHQVLNAKNIVVKSPTFSGNLNYGIARDVTEKSKNFDVRFLKTGENKNNEQNFIEYNREENQNRNENDDIELDENDNDLNESDDATTEAFKYNFESTNEEEKIQNGKNIMFDGSQTTVLEVILTIHTYCVRFNVSDEGRYALFDIIKTWAKPKLKNINFTKYMISKNLDPPENIYQYVFYCSKCYCLLEKFTQRDLSSNTERVCEKCQTNYKISTNTMNYFLSIDMKFQVKTLLENTTVRNLLLENINVIKKRLQRKSINIIKDVYDGQLYKNLYNNVEGNTFLLTFNFNSDGASISKSSKNSIWPIQIIINELPPRVRFRCILLAAMWMTTSEPSPQFMNLYLRVFIDQLRDLMQNGVKIKIANNEEMTFILKPLCATVDSVARPIIQNRLQFNGHYGCSWCYQFGKHENGTMRYPFEDEDSPLRNHNTFIENMLQAEEAKRFIMGVKGYAEITNLYNFDCVWGFPYDYMHGLLLGTVCTLWTKIWCAKGKSKFNLTKTDIKNIEKRLVNIKLTREIHRIPRSFNAGKWKASEWRSWVLYTSIPCLLGILETKYLSSFALLVRSIHILLSENITVKNLEKCRIDLIRFTGNCEEYYGLSAMTFNTHSLLHVIDHVYKSGPLSMTSTFPFENGIFILKQKLTGPKGVLKQISKRLIQKTMLENKLLNTCDNISLRHCKNLLNNSCILRKSVSKSYLDTHFLDMDNKIDEDMKHLINKKFNDNVDTNDIYIFNSMYHKNAIYRTSGKRIRKTDDRFFENIYGNIVKIFKIVLYKNECFKLGYIYTVQPLCIEDVVIDPILVLLSKSPNLIWFTLDNIRNKIVHINVENISYFCRIPNTYEIQ